jgi:cyanophycinase
MSIDSTQPGRVHLLGGGRDEDAVAALLVPFVAECATASTPPRIPVLLVLEPDDTESVDRFVRLLTRAGADAVPHAILEGEVFDASAIDGADGVFVGGGLTPAYHAAFAPIGAALRARVAAGMPYAGFSAGAAIAPDRALLGGYLVDGVVVCDEDAGEELDAVTVVDGLGLVPFSVDVHAAQWGTVSRLIAAAGAGLVAEGFAIDEHTAVGWRGGDPTSETSIRGTGSAWRVTAFGGTDPAEGTAPAGGVAVLRRTAD